MRTEAEILSKIDEYKNLLKGGFCPTPQTEGFIDYLKEEIGKGEIDKNRTCKDSDYSEGVDEGMMWLNNQISNYILE